MKPKLPYQLRKKQLFSLFIFGIFILLSHFAFAIYKSNQSYSVPNIVFETESKSTLDLISFNPNLLDTKGWINLGFSEKQVKTILKYKEVVGGKFTSKEQLKKCYAISDQKYSELESYISLPENSKSKPYNKSENKQVYNSYDIKITKYFDPNEYTISDWQKIGFTEKQAAVIVSYRDKNLRGSFKTMDDIRKCFVISEEKFEAMRPWIRFSKTQETDVKIAKQEQTDFTKVDINEITFRQLKEFGFGDKDSAMLLSFRKKLDGFMTKDQVLQTYEIDKILSEKLTNTCLLNTENVKRYRLVDAPESWLKSHPYFKYSADKIIFYRISYPEDKKIWKKLKLKPIYEDRMRLYIIDD